MIYIILSRVGHTLFSTQRLLMFPMLLSCVCHYKLKGFHLKSLKLLKQSRLGGGEQGVCIQVLKESAVSSTIAAPGSCCIPADLSAAIHLQSDGQSKRRMFDIVPSQCKHCKSWTCFQLHFQRCGAIQTDVSHTFCLRGQCGSAKPMIRPVKCSTCRHQFNELQNKAHS